MGTTPTPSRRCLRRVRIPNEGGRCDVPGSPLFTVSVSPLEDALRLSIKRPQRHCSKPACAIRCSDSLTSSKASTTAFPTAGPPGPLHINLMTRTISRPVPRFATAAAALCSIALAACNATMPKLQVANFQATAADLAGQWTGTYTCSQGLTGVRLSLTATGDKTAAGTFEFHPTATNANAGNGSFAVTAKISRPGQVDLVPGAWIVRPSGSMPVRVSAAVFSSPDQLAGTVTDAGCGRFEAERSATTAASPVRAVASASAVPPAAPPMPAMAAAAELKPTPAAAPPSPGSGAVTHAQFVTLLGKEKLPKLVGTTLALNLKRGGDGGWQGYVADPQSMVFFSCQSAAKNYAGGATVSKVKSLRSTENGVFVVLDRCGPAGSAQ